MKALVAVVALAGTARADSASIEVDREDAPAGRVELGFDGGAPLAGWGVSLGLGYVDHPIALDNNGVISRPIEHRETAVLGGAVALGQAIVLDVRLPMSHQVGDRLIGLGEPEALDRWVLGDLRIAGRARFAGSATDAVFLRAALTLPTGNGSAFAGDPRYSLSIGLVGRTTLPYGILIAGTAGIRLRGAEAMLGDRLVGDELDAAAGVSLPLPPIAHLWCTADQLRLALEAVSVLGDEIDHQRGPSPVEARAGLVAKIIPALTIGARFGVGLDDQIGAPRWRVMIELAWQGEGNLMSSFSAPTDDDSAD
jgi:hypothetical protein